MFNKTKGIISAGNQFTAQAGLDVLNAGGNVFDAALAACLMSFVSEGTLTAAGGSGFLLAQTSNGKSCLYDFFSSTPLKKRASDELDFRPVKFDFASAQQVYHIGLGSMTVGGNLAGIQSVHEDLGRIPFEELFKPAIQYARSGIFVDDYMAFLFGIVKDIWKEADDRFNYMLKDGKIIESGSTFTNNIVADTFEYLSKNGIREFYEGEMAAKVAEDCLFKGGHLQRSDFEEYEVIKRDPLQFSFSGKNILTNGAPSVGGSFVCLGLNLLEENHSSDWIAAMIETQRKINKARLTGIDKFIIANKLNEQTIQNFFGSTTHISVMDSEGNAASVTTTNGEGAGYIIPDTGIMLNNMLGEEDLMPDGFHNWKENIRISSMMAPSMITGKEGVECVLGTGGSNRIRTALMQVIFQHLNQGKNIDTAVEYPRIHIQDDVIEVEPGYNEDQLKKIIPIENESVNIWDKKAMYFGGVHSVSINKDHLNGVGDSRRSGVVLKNF